MSKPTNYDATMEFCNAKEVDVPAIIRSVNIALTEKGYAATNQITGYLISGDPSYITSHNDARNLIQKVERDDIVEVLVRYYLEHACD
ncbi:MAG TPA: IreB family regulatory phosphoprotein [Firmicutes bacterium]|nr:IreB family regulatory phosphoprotein [Bacillota bacterium]